MLRELRIGGFGVVADCTLHLHERLNVLTGETGAGKSMIVRALALLAGARADSGVLAGDVEEAEIEARFSATAATMAVLEGAGLPVDDEVVISRRIRRSGSRSYVNGRMAAAPVLGDVGATLVELIGQHSARSLVQPGVQRRALDRFGGDPVSEAADAVAEAFERLRTLQEERAGLGLDPAARARELDMVRFQLAELDAADPQPGEDAELASEIHRLTNAETLREESTEARRLAEEARDALAVCEGAMGRIDDPAVAEAARAVSAALIGAEDAAGTLREFAESCESDPQRLEDANRRMAALKDLQRKYGPTLDDVLAYRSDAAARLAAIEGAESRAAALDAEVAAADADLAAASRRLSEARAAAAPELSARVRSRLGELALGDAVFEVAVAAASEPGRHGADEVSFVFGANPGLAPRPLERIASGGEMSRVMLALATELADRDAPPTIVFDEIDAGTGGETAVAIGECLQRLAGTRQIVCITHLAQVAALADSHVVLAKESGGATATEVRAAERVRELSRMLSGQPQSARARRHAEELLKEGESLRRRTG